MSQQFQFITTVFKKVIDESNNVMGPETVQTIFRLIGENEGDAIERRLRKKYRVENWNADDFVEHFIKDVVEPALGSGMASYSKQGNEITVKIGVCPFKKAGMRIQHKLHCTYTEGMIQQSFEKALGKKVDFQTLNLISNREPECTFKIKLA